MINILLICLFVIVPVILIFCNLYLVVFFQNPEEKHMNWPCRILVILSLELLEFSILLLPADVINKGPPYGEFPMDIIWYVVYYVMLALVLLVLPFGLFWYSQDQDSRMSNKFGFSILFGVIFVAVVVVFSFVFFLIFGVSEVAVPELTSAFGTSTETLAGIDKLTGVDAGDFYLSFRISWKLFVLCSVSIIAYVLVVVFGGIGFGTLPTGLFFDFFWRPRPINSAQYKEYQQIIGNEALAMIEEGKQIETMPNGVRKRRKTEKFRKDVYSLDKALKALNKKKDLKGFLWGFIAFPLGVLSVIMSVVWVVQLICRVIPGLSFGFIDEGLRSLNGSLAIFGAAIYGIFAFYLFACVFKAIAYIGFRFACGIAFYPLEVGNTNMDGFLFNCMLLSMSSIGVTLICTWCFRYFTEGTAVQAFFGELITQIRYIRYIYQYAPVIMPVLGIAFAAFMIISKIVCKHVREKDALEVLLEKRKTAKN